MPLQIEKAAETGFCFGVKRALDIIEKAAREHGTIETLGAIVHNQPVLDRLASAGVRISRSVDEIQGSIVATRTHGISPQIEQELLARRVKIIDTTCPFVHRAQLTARDMSRAGFFVVVYGDGAHPEVKGVLGWAGDGSLATLDDEAVSKLKPLPQRLGILSQTTQIPAHFKEFAKRVLHHTFREHSELRIADTICDDSRKRQSLARELALRVELMLVIGGHHSANTNQLAQLCAEVTEARLIESAGELKDAWFQEHRRIGIISGTSTSEETISEIIAQLNTLP